MNFQSNLRSRGIGEYTFNEKVSIPCWYGYGTRKRTIYEREQDSERKRVLIFCDNCKCGDRAGVCRVTGKANRHTKVDENRRAAFRAHP